MDWAWPLRILLALGLSGILGFEREAGEHAAGLRTHMLVGTGATLFTLVSSEFAGGDTARVAAQVVTGVGFLGAGVIFRRGATVRGLTTAANLWVVAAIGVVVGVGKLAEAGLATGVAFVVLAIVKAVERRFGSGGRTGKLELDVEGAQQLSSVLTFLYTRGIHAPEVRSGEAGARFRVEAEVDSNRIDALRVALEGTEGVLVAGSQPGGEEAS